MVDAAVDETTAPAVSTPQRIVSYDAMRVLAAVAVVAIHVMAAGMSARGPEGARALWVFNTYTFIWFATPAFAFLSAALIWAPRRPIRGWAEYVSFLRRRAKVVLLPYLFWTAFYILFARYTPSALRPQMPLSRYALDVVKLLLLGRASFHLYFIPVVLEMYLVAPLVSRAFARRPLLAAIPLWALGAFTTLVFKAPPSDHLVTAYRMMQYTLWLLPAAVAGAWYGTVRERIGPALLRIWPIILISGLGLRWLDRSPLLVTNDWQQRTVETVAMMLTLLGLVTMLGFLVRRLSISSARTEYLGSLAFGVYLVHPVIVAFVEDGIARVGLASLWVSPAFTVAAIAGVALICFALVGFLMRFPLVAWVFGGRRARTAKSPGPAARPESATEAAASRSVP